MINFPTWVNTPKRQSKQQLASKRLRYLMCSVALRYNGRGNIASFAEIIGLETTTVALYVRKGQLSKSAADKAESIFGSDAVRADWLVNPLDIPEVV